MANTLRAAASPPFAFYHSPLEWPVEGRVAERSCVLWKRRSPFSRRGTTPFELRLKFLSSEGGTLLEGRFGPGLDTLLVAAVLAVALVSFLVASLVAADSVGSAAGYVLLALAGGAVAAAMLLSGGLAESLVVEFVEETLRDGEALRSKAVPIRRASGSDGATLEEISGGGGITIRPRRYRTVDESARR